MENQENDTENNREFIISDLLTLRLERDKTMIYVAGESFLQCKSLILNIIKKNSEDYRFLQSIDEAAEVLGRTSDPHLAIPPEIEFWGHCSNLQAWYEHGYDTRLLHRNLAFPLLKSLVSAGDVSAEKAFKEEIAQRLIEGNENVVKFLLELHYLDYLSTPELDALKGQISREGGEACKEFFAEKLRELKNSRKEAERQKEVYELYDKLERILNKKDLDEIQYVVYEGRKYFIVDNTLRIRGVNKFSEIQGLNNIKRLENLKLNGVRLIDSNGMIEEISYLNSLADVEMIDLSNNKLMNFNQLKYFLKLKKLYLSSNNISNLKGLENLTQLEIISLSFNQLKKIDNLRNLTNLKILELDSNELSKISNLNGLRKLEYLDLSHNKISEIQGLNNLPNLKTLYLSDNQITRIMGLDNLENLETLYLDNNMITEIEGLDKLVNLKTLRLDSNKIREITGLSQLCSLESLDLTDNNLQNPYEERIYEGKELDDILW